MLRRFFPKGSVELQFPHVVAVDLMLYHNQHSSEVEMTSLHLQYGSGYERKDKYLFQVSEFNYSVKPCNFCAIVFF